MSPRPRTTLLLVVLLCAACSARDGGPAADGGPGGPELGAADAPSTEPGADASDDAAPRPAHCNPLGTIDCLLPWPSSCYLTADATRATGWRVSYPAAALPENAKGVRVSPERYNQLDGFSIGSQPIVAFPGGISAAGLPGPHEIASSLSDASPLWILERDTGARVPLFAEVDANAEPGQAALIIRPQRPLRFDTTHVVVLRRGLKDASGAPLAAPVAFARIRDGLPLTDPALRAEAERLAPVLAFLDAQRIARAEVLLAWDFHTGSAEAITGPLVRMVDRALAALPADGPRFAEIDAVDRDPALSPFQLRAVRGTISVPSFLASEDPDARLQRDADGEPVLRGEQRFPFFVSIPRCAATASAPLPVLLLGHGLLDDPEGLVDGWLQNRALERMCMVGVGTAWIGLSDVDVAAVAGSVTTDLSNLPRITDHLQQAQVNQAVLARLLRGKLREHPALQLNGQPVTDGAQVYYIGYSLGGIQGGVLAAVSPDVERAVLHVGGGFWSMMLERSSDFAVFSALMRGAYPSATDRLLLLALSQSLWDPVDPMAHAAHWRGTPYPGRPRKHVLLQESRYDDQVPNLATRVLARAGALPLLVPQVESVFGVEESPGPLDAAYAQWDVAPPFEPPAGNVTAKAPPEDQSAHYGVRRLESFDAQVERFLRPGGQVEHTCDGPCGRQ